MKVKCDKCGEIKEMQYLGNGMYQVSEEMKEHEKEHKGKVGWEIVEGTGTTIKDLLQERLTQAKSEREREAILSNLKSIEALEKYDAYINVWNCQATLVINIENIKIDDELISLFLTEKEAKKLQDLIYESINEFGAINFSGQYGITQKLARFLNKIMKKYGKAIVEVAKREEKIKSEYKERLEKKEFENDIYQAILYKLGEGININDENIKKIIDWLTIEQFQVTQARKHTTEEIKNAIKTIVGNEEYKLFYQQKAEKFVV